MQFQLPTAIFHIALLAAVHGASAEYSVTDPWAPLRFLEGEWRGESQGRPGKGNASRQYRFVLNNRFLQINNKSVYLAQEKNPKGETHEDIGYFSYDKIAKKLVLRQFHIEGFVNQFVVHNVSDNGRKVIFVTTSIENIPEGWRARETYRMIANDEFVQTFDLAESGKQFETYSEIHFHRKK